MATSSKGRSARKPKEQTVVAMSLRVTPEEIATFHAKAEEVGLSLAAWARTQLRRAAGLPTG
jgi:hypothetical protein